MTVSYSRYASWSPELQARYRNRYGSAPKPVASTNPPNPSFKAWDPWSSSPPSGTFDPSLDAAAGAANRGYQDLTADSGTQDLRDTVDYGLQREDITRSRDQQLADLNQGLSRGTEDYNRNVAMLTRAYQVKGNVQKQQENAYGVLAGGAALQAARKRAANEATDRQPLDTSLSRLQQDTSTGVERTNTAADTALGKLALMMAPPDAANPLGGRSFQDRATALTRGGRENAQFGIDTEAQKSFQAAGTGWDPGTRPRGQFVSPDGKPYEVKVVGNIKYRVDPQGHVLSKQLRPRSRRRG